MQKLNEMLTNNNAQKQSALNWRNLADMIERLDIIDDHRVSFKSIYPIKPFLIRVEEVSLQHTHQIYIIIYNPHISHKT